MDCANSVNLSVGHVKRCVGQSEADIFAVPLSEEHLSMEVKTCFTIKPSVEIVHLIDRNVNRIIFFTFFIIIGCNTWSS